MSRWSPCKRREFVRRLRALGFDGPFSGTQHQFMTFGSHRLTIPSNEELYCPFANIFIGFLNSDLQSSQAFES